ncbi:hypothetical protein GCM10028791_34590 [Echinicola sediminis]
MKVFPFENKVGDKPDDIDQVKKDNADIGNTEVEEGHPPGVGLIKK